MQQYVNQVTQAVKTAGRRPKDVKTEEQMKEQRKLMKQAKEKSHTSSGKSQIGVGVDEYFEVEVLSDPGVIERVYALEDDDISAVKGVGLGEATVRHKGVHGDLHSLTRLQSIQSLQHRRPIKRV